MNCERCKEPDADCRTRDGARVCQTCLYEQVERERDLLREEVVRLRRTGEVLIRSIAKMTAERDALLTEIERLRARVAELEHPMSYMPPSAERCKALLAIAQRERDEAHERISALMKGEER